MIDLPLQLSSQVLENLEFRPTAEQELAIKELEEFLKNDKAKCISLSGLAGSGKTSTLRELIQRLPNLAAMSRKDGNLHGNNKVSTSIAMTGTTGKAAQRLSQVTGKYCKTLHSTLYEKPNIDFEKLSFEELQEPACKILIIDEASTLTPKTYNDLTTWMDKGVKVIFVGDFFQLPPILDKDEEKRYGTDFSIFSEVKGPILTKVMRTNNRIVEVGSYIRENKILPRTSYDNDYIFKVAANPTLAAIEEYMKDPEDHVLITWTNEKRMEANAIIRNRLQLKSIVMGNEPVLICKNGQGLLNGEIRKITNISNGPKIGPIQTYFAQFEGLERDGIPKSVLVILGGKAPMDGTMPYIANKSDWSKYRKELNSQKLPDPLPLTYSYALTAHKVQGSQARRATIFLRRSELINPAFLKMTTLPNGDKASFGSRFLYTCVTRAVERATVILDQ